LLLGLEGDGLHPPTVYLPVALGLANRKGVEVYLNKEVHQHVVETG